MCKSLATIIILSSFNITSISASNLSYNETSSNLNENDAIASLSFDINKMEKQEKTIILEDGTEMTFGAEPIVTNNRALNGTWRIYGYNPLATMEYYIVLSGSGNYTTISKAYGLAISGRLSSFENEKINIVRKTETSSNPAIVEGYAKFNYLGNQWISIWQQSGGVRAKIKNNIITTELY